MDVFSGVLPFVTVARERNFRRAAEELGVSTAAVSKSIARLERDLGVTLFNRTSRHVALTAEGSLFLERCSSAVDQLRAGRDLLARSGKVPTGTLKVSISPILGRVIVPKLAALSERHPRLDFRLQITDRFVKVAEEDVDVVVRIGELGNSALTGRVLGRPMWKAVATPAYLAKRGTPRTIVDLQSHNCLRFVTPRGAPRAWTFLPRRTASEPESVEVNGGLLIDDGQLLLEAALAGHGIAQVFDFMVEEPLRTGKLIEVLPELAAEGPAIHALWLPRRAQAAKVRVFVDLLVSAFGGD